MNIRRTLGLALLGVILAPGVSIAQSVTPSERDALVRLRTDRGGRAEEVDGLLRIADAAAAKGLPPSALTNKIREGLAKNVEPPRIEAVIRQMSSQLETADGLIREIDPAASRGPVRDGAVTLLAEAIGSGVTADETRELRRSASTGRPPATSATPIGVDTLASAAKGLSFVKEAKLPAADGTAVMVEAVRQGFRSHELLDLGREIKLREVDYRAGRASLRTLRDAIARGERPEQLFRDSRPATVERPAAARPDVPADRPARPEPAPQRPEPPVRPATRDR